MKKATLGLLTMGLWLGLAGTLDASTLGDLAASMQPGTWAELTTTNIVPALVNASGGILTVYTDDMVWDPNSRQAFFIGAYHLAPEGPQFVSYTESTNSWQRLPRPSWLAAAVFFHGYDHSAIDQANGIVYHRGYNSETVHRYNIASQTWSQTPGLPFGDPGNCCDALEYFPELGGLVWVNGSGYVYLYRESTNQWTKLTTIQQSQSNTWQQAEYSPVHKVMVFLLGGKLYKLSSSGQVTQVANPAVSLYSGSGYNGVLTVDPVSGKYLILTPDSRQFYTYDVLTDTWQAQSSPTKPDMSNRGVTATPVNTHGVTFFTSCSSASNCRAYVYKHAAGGGTPPPSDSTPPVISAVTTSNLTSSGAAITWTTNEASDTQVEYGSTTSYGSQSALNSSLVTSHSQTLSGLTANTLYHFRVKSRDAGGNLATSGDVVFTTTTVSPPPPPSGGTTFAQKCAQAGVINCFGFDDPNQLLYAWQTGTVCDTALAGKTRYSLTNARGSNEGNTVATIQNGQCVYPQFDSSLKSSGTGSVKFTIPSNSSANSSGFFSEPFKRNADGTFQYVAPGSPLGNVVYWQFYQYFDQTFLNTTYICNGGTLTDPGCGGWKQIIWYGNPPNGSSASNMEITHVNGWQRGIPMMYGQIGYDGYGWQDVRGCTYNFNGQHNYTEPPCIRYKAGQWMEFTVRVEVRGAPNAPESRVQLWVDGQLAIDKPDAKIDWSGAGNGLGQFQITPYHTNKDSNQVHPTGYTWYDDVIVSTQPIAMRSGSTPPPSDTTPPAPPTSLSAN